MSADYFQDITPPAESGRPAPPRAPQEAPDERPEDAAEIPIRVSEAAPPPRGIRSIAPPPRARTRIAPEEREEGAFAPPRRRRMPRWWIWGAAALAVLIVAALGFFAFRPTAISVTPKSHRLVLRDMPPLTAYPAALAATGTLPYTVEMTELEDSETVPAQGTTYVETKASGRITVLNDYSTQSVRLIPATRFETPDGLIFRAPAEIVVPGKSAAGPGRVTVLVVADQPGDRYNVGPVQKFTVPGLKSTAAMYAGVYAQSAEPMSGGFAGEQPGTAPGAVESARALVRARLEAKAAALAAPDKDTVRVPAVRIAYEDAPNVPEGEGSVRIGEKAHVESIDMPAGVFAQMVARTASADAEGASVRLVPGEGFSIAVASSSQEAQLGSDPVDFILSGEATLVWDVQIAELVSALAGRSEDAFQTIVNGFPGIQEARARIEPFWKNSFPSDPKDIQVVVADPSAE